MSLAEERCVVTTTAAPHAVGPYSQAIVYRGMLYCSGALPLDPSTGTLVAGGPAEHARQSLKNLRAVCVEAGADLKSAVRVGVYVRDLGAFDDINRVYAEFFDGQPPARTTIEVAGLPKAALVEMDATVPIPKPALATT